MKTKNLLWAIFALLSTCRLYATTDSLQTTPTLTDEQYEIAYQAFVDSLDQTLKYEVDEITLKNGIATISVPEGFKYLNGKDSEMILTEVWGNPPNEKNDQSLGMLMPLNSSPMSDSSYAINITYSEDGYIDDEDAKDIDYDELLSTMQADSEEFNEARIQQGYLPIEFVNWASPPFYDAENKKLHWAKELKFGDIPTNTLNYNIRILGRKGYLQLNAIGEMYVLGEVKRGIDPILASVNFSNGYRYADFNPDIDKVAAYGIGGLIAGKVLLKAGILAKIGLILAKFWKFIALGLVGLFAGIKKFMGNKEPTVETEQEGPA